MYVKNVKISMQHTYSTYENTLGVTPFVILFSRTTMHQFFKSMFIASSRYKYPDKNLGVKFLMNFLYSCRLVSAYAIFYRGVNRLLLAEEYGKV